MTEFISYWFTNCNTIIKF